MISLDNPHLLEHAYPHTWLQHSKQQVSQSLHNPITLPTSPFFIFIKQQDHQLKQPIHTHTNPNPY
jgi:hypothetical protein